MYSVRAFLCFCGTGQTWWRHQMETFSALLALCVGNSPVTGEFPAQRPVTRNFDAFFDLGLNKLLSKQARRRWFEIPSRSSWRQCNEFTSCLRRYVTDHYSDVTWTSCSLESLANSIACSKHVQVTSRKHLNSVLMALCGWNPSLIYLFPHKESVMRKTFPFHDVIERVAGDKNI